MDCIIVFISSILPTAYCKNLVEFWHFNAAKIQIVNLFTFQYQEEKRVLALSALYNPIGLNNYSINTIQYEKISITSIGSYFNNVNASCFICTV